MTLTEQDTEIIDGLTARYAKRVAHVPPLIRNSMIISFKAGAIDIMSMFYEMAKEETLKRAEQLVTEDIERKEELSGNTPSAE